MADYGTMSDAELMAIVQPKAAAQSDYSKMSDAELMKAVGGGGKAPQGFMANATDFVKSIPHGVVQGLKSASSMQGAMSPVPIEEELAAVQPTREQASKTLTAATHEPQGPYGKIGSAVGEPFGNPITYAGPGGPLLKIAGGALSGAGSEIGRQLAEGTKYEIPAQIAGSVAGGVVGAKALGPAAERAVVPTYRELKTAANADYQAARNSGLELHPQGVAQFAAKAEQELTGPDHGFTGGQYGDAPKTLAVLDTLQKPPAGAVVSASNIDAVRKNLGRLSRETVEGKPTPDAAAASVALGNLNKYVENIPANHILAGDAAKYLSATKQGNANYAASQRVRTVDSKINAAELNTEGGIATSIDNQIKAQIRTILKSEKAQRGFTAEEIAALRALNKGTITSNTLRQLGRGGAGVVPLSMHAVGAAASGGALLLPQAALAAGLYGARKTAESMTKSKARDVAEMLAKRSPEYQSRASRVPHTSNAPHIAAIARALATGAMR